MAPAFLGNSLYQIVEGPLWTDASTNAQYIGGALASVSSATENSYLITEFSIGGMYNPSTKKSDLGAIPYWIGLSDLEAEGKWKWEDDSPTSYLNWWKESPNGGTKENYVYLGGYTDGTWDDQPNKFGHQAWTPKGIAEIPISSSITLSSTPQEGQEFTTTINLSAGNTSSGNLANGAKVYWKITGITAEDISSGSLTGSGTINDGSLSFKTTLKQDGDQGEQFEVSVFSDAEMTAQIGTTKSTEIQEAPVLLGNSLYQIVQGGGSSPDGTNWKIAQQNAQSIGGYLASINTAAENQFLVEQFTPQDQSKGQAYAIGLIDDKNGNWKWTDGTTLNWYNWAGNDGSTVSSAYLNGTKAEQWATNDVTLNINVPWATAYNGKWQNGTPPPGTEGIAEIPITTNITFSEAVKEGGSISSTINLTAGSSSSGNLANGLSIYWKILGIDKADLSSGDLQGSGVIKEGKLTLSHTLAKDDVVENETIALSIYSDKECKYKIGDTATIAIEDTSAQVPVSKQPTPAQKQKTYSISPSLKILQEGGFLVTTIETSGLSKGTELYWQLSGIGITAADFSYGSLSGSGFVNGDGEFSFAHSLKLDGIQEGDELLNIKLFSDSTFTNQVGSTAYVILEDVASQGSTTTQPIFKPTDSGNSKQGTSSSQDLFSFFADLIGSKSTNNSLLQQLKISIDWLDVDFDQVTTEKKKNFSWKYVDLGQAGSNTSLSTTDLFQVKAATGDLTSTYTSTQWNLLNIGEFSSETYASTDWSLVKFGDVTTESKKTMDWSKVTDGFLTNESKTTTDDFQWSINNDIAASGKLSKKTKWNKVNIGEFSSETYSAMDWSQVNIGKFQKFGSSSIDWTEVQFGEFQSKQYKQMNWSQVNIGDFTAEDYSEINWGQVAFKGSKSVNYSALDWSLVDFGDFKKSSFKNVDWSQVKTADLTEQQYSDINWGQVKFKGSKAPSLSDLDLSLVIGSSTFSKKTAKQIDWTQVSTDDLSSSALSKLSGLGVKKKGVNVAELLQPSTQSKELSFAGVGQAQGGALTTGLESSSSGSGVLLAAVESKGVLT